MGLIGNFVIKKTLSAAGNLTMTKTLKHMENKHSVGNILKKGSMANFLVVEKRTFFTRKKFIVLDKEKHQKYNIQFDDNIIKLFDDTKLLGKVTLRKKLKEQSIEFDLYFGGKKLGIIQSKISVKPKFYIPFYNYQVQGSLLQYDFDVFNYEGKNIIKIHKDFSENNYVVEYNDKSNEQIGLLILMAIELFAKYE